MTLTKRTRAAWLGVFCVIRDAAAWAIFLAVIVYAFMPPL
jgi:hypothetical protein